MEERNCSDRRLTRGLQEGQARGISQEGLRVRRCRGRADADWRAAGKPEITGPHFRKGCGVKLECPAGL